MYSSVDPASLERGTGAAKRQPKRYSTQRRKAHRESYARKISNDRRRQRLACCRQDGNERSDVAIKKATNGEKKEGVMFSASS